MKQLKSLGNNFFAFIKKAIVPVLITSLASFSFWFIQHSIVKEKEEQERKKEYSNSFTTKLLETINNSSGYCVITYLHRVEMGYDKFSLSTGDYTHTIDYEKESDVLLQLKQKYPDDYDLYLRNYNSLLEVNIAAMQVVDLFHENEELKLSIAALLMTFSNDHVDNIISKEMAEHDLAFKDLNIYFIRKLINEDRRELLQKVLDLLYEEVY